MNEEDLKLRIRLEKERRKRKSAEDLSVYEAVNPNDFESEEPEMFPANAPLDYDALKSQKMPKVLEDKKKESDDWYSKEADKAIKKKIIQPKKDSPILDKINIFNTGDSSRGAFLRGIPEGALFSFDDELLGSANVLLGEDVGTTKDMSYSDKLAKRYYDVRNEARAQKEKDMKDFAAANIAGNIAGGIMASALVGPGSSLESLVSPTTIKGLAASGALAGLGASESIGKPLEAGKDVLLGAGIGAGIGAAGKGLKLGKNIAGEIYDATIATPARNIYNKALKKTEKALVPKPNKDAMKNLEYLESIDPVSREGLERLFPTVTEAEVNAGIKQAQDTFEKEAAKRFPRIYEPGTDLNTLKQKVSDNITKPSKKQKALKDLDYLASIDPQNPEVIHKIKAPLSQEQIKQTYKQAQDSFEEELSKRFPEYSGGSINSGILRGALEQREAGRQAVKDIIKKSSLIDPENYQDGRFILSPTKAQISAAEKELLDKVPKEDLRKQALINIEKKKLIENMPKKDLSSLRDEAEKLIKQDYDTDLTIEQLRKNPEFNKEVDRIIEFLIAERNKINQQAADKFYDPIKSTIKENVSKQVGKGIAGQVSGMPYYGTVPTDIALGMALGIPPIATGSKIAGSWLGKNADKTTAINKTLEFAIAKAIMLSDPALFKAMNPKIFNFVNKTGVVTDGLVKAFAAQSNKEINNILKQQQIANDKFMEKVGK